MRRSIRYTALLLTAVAWGCSSSPNEAVDEPSGDDTVGGTGGAGGGGGQVADAGKDGSKTGTGGAKGTGGSTQTGAGGTQTGAGGTQTGAGGTLTPSDASLVFSDQESPAPPGDWANATGNLAGLTSECGNLSSIHSHPAMDMLIAGVAQQGLWASGDGGKTYQHLGDKGGDTITNRPLTIAFDPASPSIWWEAGIYNANGVYRTTDNGNSLYALGDVVRTDTVSIDFTDPNRSTLLAGGHEAPDVYLSVDGGQSWTKDGYNWPGQCTSVLVIDKNTMLVGCGGWGNAKGIYRSTDGASSWQSISGEATQSSAPLVASDGTIYWARFPDGLLKSTDKGQTFAVVADKTKAGSWTPVELPDGRIASATSSAIMVSADKGVTWTQAGKSFPSGYNPNSFTYSPFRNAFYIARFSCNFTNDAVQADAIMQMGWAWK